MKEQRKRIQKQVKSKMTDISAYEMVKGDITAPSANAINNMLKADNFNINTLLYALEKLGGTLKIEWNK